MNPIRPSIGALVLAALTLVSMLLASAPSALATTPWWRINSEVVPTHLPPGGEGEIVVAVTNLSDVPVSGAQTPLTITDALPEAVKATSLTGEALEETGRGAEVRCPTAVPTPPLSCTFAQGTLNPYERLAFTIKVKVQEPAGTVASLPNEVTVEGGGAARASRTQQMQVSGEPTPFGVQDFALVPANEEGTPAAQAGAHPFQLTTSLTLNQITGRQPAALPRDLSFDLPPGLIGNPTATKQCSDVDFAALVREANLCPPSSVVGVASVVAYEPIVKILTKTVPVFNLVPAQGEPARFGFEIGGKIPVVIDTAVRSGRDYGVVASVKEATQTGGLLSSQVTLWGVPGDPRHDNARGWECVSGGFYEQEIKKSCPANSSLPEEPFLRMPTSCPADPAAEPLSTSLEANSWANSGSYLSAEYAWLNEGGQGISTMNCAALPFTPEIGVSPEEHTASTPTGLIVDVKVPQQTTLEAGSLAEADLRDTTVTLPEGVMLSPSAASGLEACSEAQIGFTGFDQATQTDEFNTARPLCPEGAKVGVVHIKTPLLPHELEGSVYLATPAPDGETGMNPFGSLIALYLVAEDPVSGVQVKLAGDGQLNEANQQISTSFRNTPQVPFEELTLKLFGGPRASLTTPAMCGGYATDAAFTPWSGTPTLNLSSPPGEFQITAGVRGSPCPAGQPFNPGLNVQSTNTAAGAFTPFTLELTRSDSDQAIDGLSMHLPPGIAAMLSSVSLCREPLASTGSCPASSEVGQAVESAGLGPEPFTVGGGRVYLTGPYAGAPFGLSIVTPAVAGPFNLGNVIVRSRIVIDPGDASVTIVSDPLPTQLKGIPLQLKRIQVLVDRPDFEFNPTSCNPMRVDATLDGSGGAQAQLSSPFQVGGCQNLPFKPNLTASTKGQASKANGANFDVTVRSAGLGQANIAKVRLQLPKALPARLTTLQKACTEGAFNTNPASCPAGSVIGQATIHTPVLSNPLTGPAYLVSHGGAAFPDVEFVLQGEGITLVLDGKTQIKNQITYSKFESAPDAPFTVFETELPAGPHSALTTNLPEKAKFNLCSSSLSMPTEIVGQNGAVIHQNTKIALRGCKTVKASKPRKLSRGQLLNRALRGCRKQHKRSKARRVTCEKQARARYAVKAVHKSKKTPAHP